MPGPVGLAGELFDDGTRLYDASFDGREQHQTHSQAHDEANASKAGRPPAPPTPHPTSGRSRGGRAGRHNPKWRNWKPLTNLTVEWLFQHAIPAGATERLPT